MKRIPRRDEAADRFRGGIASVLLIGFAAGILAGLSRIAANRYPDAGLPNLAIAAFTAELNRVFFFSAAVGIPVIFLVYVLYRIAPRSFPRTTAVLFLLVSVLAVSRTDFYRGSISASEWSPLLVARRTLLLLFCLAAARLLRETFPFFRTLRVLSSLRIPLLLVFLLAAANSGAVINHMKNMPRGSNVILITFDSIRADHLGFFGYERPTSPALDRIASEGVVFGSAFTTCPESPQALASVLTGRWPRTHGVRRMWDLLGQAQVSLAELLSDKGYVAGAFVSLPGPKRKSGFEQGFDRFFLDETHESERITGEAIRWIDSERKRPVFAWIHYADARMPYEPSASGSAFAAPFGPGASREGFRYEPTRACRVFGHERLAADDSARAVALYDGEIRRVDDEIDRLLGHLERTDRIHDTTILIAGTHGESLGEHEYFFDHGDFLFDTSLRVPMILRAANLPSRVVPTQARLVDLLPTILDVLHLPIPADIDGRSLLGTVERPDGFPDLPVFAESEVSLFPAVNRRRPIPGIEGKLEAVRERGWKLILYPTRTGVRAELYDLSTDPGETVDRAADFPEIAAALRATLEQWKAGSPPASVRKESPPPDWVFAAGDPPATP
jgi:arylsulfatase A-like enzyme